MKHWVRTRLARMLAGILCAGMAATWAVGEVLDKHEEVRREKQEVARMTEKMKTECVGRFLIDMPDGASVERGQARIDGFKITSFTEDFGDFQNRVAERALQIGAKPDRLGGNKNLESAKDVKTDSGFVGKIFVHSRTVTEGTQGNGLELERYRYEGLTVEALVHSNGVSIDLSSENRDPNWIDDLPALVGKLVANPDNRIPAEPGFCIDRAYVRDPLTADQREEVTMFAQLPNHPDIDLMLILAAGVKPDEQGLLERSDAAIGRLSMEERMRISRLRAAPREIAGLAGEELVKSVVEENDAHVHSFWWEVNGTADKVAIPHIVLKMTTGNSNDRPVPSSLSDGAALGLWDKISSSIRLRPAEPPKPSRVEAPSTPLGTYALAGDRCPHSGWWLCGDGGNGVGVLGGQRQYMKKGERMPQALLLLPQTLWDKLRGLQPSAEAKHPSPWKLVDMRARKRVPPPLPLAKARSTVPAGTTMTIAAGTGSDEPRVPVGSYSATGHPCPASGWWRCEESHALDGTRWFAQGSLLPPATFTVAPGIFGQSSNTPRAIQRRSAWRLMRLASEADHAIAEADVDADSADPTRPPARQA